MYLNRNKVKIAKETLYTILIIELKFDKNMKRKFKEAMVINSTNINKMNITELTEHKKEPTYDENQDPGLRQAQTCGGVKLVNGIPTLPS